MIFRRFAIAGVTALLLGGITAGASAASPAEAAPVVAAMWSPLPCSQPTGGKLSYLGGPVFSDAWVFIDFWGSWWKTHGITAQKALEGLFSGLGPSSWARTLSQYCYEQFSPDQWTHPGEESGSVLYEGSVRYGTTIDTRNPPASPTNAQMAAEAWREDPDQWDHGTTMVIVTPPGVTPAGDLNTKGKIYACARHSWTAFKEPHDPSTTDGQMWIDLPYGIISSTASIFSFGADCQYGQGPIAGLTVNAGHEYAEQQTDNFINSQLITSSPPYKVGSGWGILNGPGGSVGDEIADICAPGPSDVNSWLVLRHTNVFQLKLSTGTFWMQKLWSNKAGACVEGS